MLIYRGLLLVNQTFCFKSEEWRHVISVESGIPNLQQIKLTRYRISGVIDVPTSVDIMYSWI